jgi:hypothetical protein
LGLIDLINHEVAQRKSQRFTKDFKEFKVNIP